MAAAAFAAIALGTTTVAAEDAQDGQRAYDAEQFELARRLWTPAAERGEVGAQIGLATMFDLGRGVPRDPVAAYSWYRRAAEAGVAEAEFDVAVLRDTGDGVSRDVADAALWYARAGARGNHRAQYNLGQLYQSGEGVPRNIGAAESWFRAASASVPAAADQLAVLRRQPPPHTSAGDAGPPAPVQLCAPVAGSTVADQAGTVELVWTPPAQSPPVRHFVQLLALTGTAAAPAPVELFGGYVEETATVAPLARASLPQAAAGQPGPPNAREYAWRVYSVSAEARSYTATEWASFTVKPAN